MWPSGPGHLDLPEDTDITVSSDTPGRPRLGLSASWCPEHATDTRAKVVIVTSRGRALAIEAINRVEDADAAFFAEYPASLTSGLRRTARSG